MSSPLQGLEAGTLTLFDNGRGTVVEVAVTEPGRISVRCRETKGPVEFIRHESHTTLALLAKAVADFEERSKAWVIPANPKEFIAPVVTPPPPSDRPGDKPSLVPVDDPAVKWEDPKMFAIWVLRDGLRIPSDGGFARIVPQQVFGTIGEGVRKRRYGNVTIGKMIKHAEKTNLVGITLSENWLKELAK
jgi:hypothetical protein